MNANEEQSSSNVTDWDRIPDTGSGDPYDGNPFSKNDIRYRTWELATLKAAQEVSVLSLELMNCKLGA